MSLSLSLSLTSGLIEAIPDTVSLDALKKKDSQYTTLSDFFERFFGIEGSLTFTTARDRFISSLAGYSIICYILNLKDRHNGNILLDIEGHIIHIDYGFVLGNVPLINFVVQYSIIMYSIVLHDKISLFVFTFFSTHVTILFVLDFILFLLFLPLIFSFFCHCHCFYSYPHYISFPPFSSPSPPQARPPVVISGSSLLHSS